MPGVWQEAGKKEPKSRQTYGEWLKALGIESIIRKRRNTLLEYKTERDMTKEEILKLRDTAEQTR
ncbi:MAG: hypothetical protein J5965_08865, partial [Aeriscardovia sp.]|nr:hypothetical protein [Aeriscardovia sp.]